MPLLNYTTSIATAKTLGEIQRVLVSVGARSVMTNYDADGSARGVAFSVETMHGPRSFTLPVNTQSVLAVLKRDKVPVRYRTPEQAERVAWRIVKDWLEAQAAIIRTEMVTLDQVMLPYMHSDSGPTVYEMYRNQQLALGSGVDA